MKLLDEKLDPGLEILLCRLVLKDIRKGKIILFAGDKVEIHTNRATFLVTVKGPSLHKSDRFGRCYLLNESNSLFDASELKIVKVNPDGKKQTVAELLNLCREARRILRLCKPCS